MSTAATPNESHRAAEALDPSNIGSLLGDIGSDLSLLVRQEIELAKAEARQSASEAGKGAGFLGGAGVAANLALTFLSLALWWAIGQVTGLGWSALIVGVLWGIVAAVLAAMGKGRLSRMSGLRQTTETAKEIPDAMKGKGPVR